VQNSSAVSSLTVQLQVNDQLCVKHYNGLVSYADKDLSYKGAKKVCLRQDVYYATSIFSAHS
jgi:hypothetical protein